MMGILHIFDQHLNQEITLIGSDKLQTIHKGIRISQTQRFHLSSCTISIFDELRSAKLI